jgi:hypothetical protein
VASIFGPGGRGAFDEVERAVEIARVVGVGHVAAAQRVEEQAQLAVVSAGANALRSARFWRSMARIRSKRLKSST